MRISAYVSMAAAAALLAGGAANAASRTTTFQVSAQVVGNCLVAASPLNLGTYDGTGADRDNTSTITVRCANGTGYTLGLDDGSGAGTFTTRLLTSGSNTLQYNLFTDTAHSNVWGDGTPSTFTVTGTGSGMSSTQEKQHTVYGRLFNNTTNQDAPAGTYTDTITVTITY